MTGEWHPIETAPSDDGWISRALFAIRRPWGWEMWVGQCDAGDIWLGRTDDGACFDTEAPTHWQPLPEPREVIESPDDFAQRARQERELLETAFCALHRKAQTLAYEVSIRPQEGEDWEPVRRAVDELVTELGENMPIEASREAPVDNHSGRNASWGWP